MFITDDHVTRLVEIMSETLMSAGSRDVGNTLADAFPLSGDSLLKNIHLVGTEIDQISRKVAERLHLDLSMSESEIGRLLRRFPCDDRQEHRPIDGYSLRDFSEDLWYRVVLIDTQHRVSVSALLHT